MRESPRRLPLDRVQAAFLADCRARHLSPKTLEHYEASLRSYRRFVGPDTATQVVVDLELGRARAWATSLADRRSPASVGNAIAGLKVFSHWLVAEDYLRTDPLGRLRKPRTQPPVIRPLARDQGLALLAASTPHLRPVLMLLLDTGLRISEATALRVADVRGGVIHVRCGKGGRERLVPAGRQLQAAIDRYLSRGRASRIRSDQDPLFLNARGDPLTAASVRQSLRRMGVRLGIEDVRVSPHTLRHTFARQFILNGGGELALQQLLGHSDLTQVRRYVALDETDLAGIHAAASPLDRWTSRVRTGR